MILRFRPACSAIAVFAVPALLLSACGGQADPSPRFEAGPPPASFGGPFARSNTGTTGVSSGANVPVNNVSNGASAVPGGNMQRDGQPFDMPISTSGAVAPATGARSQTSSSPQAMGANVDSGLPWQAPVLDPSTPVGRNGQLRVEGRNLVNENGQPIQLEGISSMWLNWENLYSQNKQGLQWLRDNWNITLYRVALGVEPDNAYLAEPEEMMARLRTAVQNAIDLGLYVMIDWHAHEAHQSPEAAERFFSEVAAEFGQFPHVLYETFNEPLGDHDWSQTIKPYHERVIPAIRAQDPDGVIILGNRQWDQRPDEAAADPVAGENLMYTVHFYACDHQGQVRADAQEAYDAGLALFVTEWGATPADGGAANPIVCAEAAQDWHDWMDERSIGSAAWKFDTCDDSSCFFSRPDAPIDGGWTDEWLTDHAKFIRARLLD